MSFHSVLKRAAPSGAAALAALAIGGAAANLTYAASLNQDLNSPKAPPGVAPASGHKQSVVGPGKAGRAPPAVTERALSAGPQPSAANTANTVNRLLAPRASDPKVPLPQENLAQEPAAYAPLDGPRIFGRGEQGGAVLGFKIPIPADHGAFDSPTRSGSGQVRLDSAP
jgi:hypothetical protein